MHYPSITLQYPYHREWAMHYPSITLKYPYHRE